MLLLFLTFSVLVANPKKLLYTVANPARGLLNREKRTKEKVWQHTPPPPHTARSEKINKITRRIYRRYAGGRSRVRTRIPSARRLGPYPVIYVVANPVRGHKEVPRSTGHIMVTTRYSDQQGSKSRQKVMRLYKRWHRPIAKRFIKLPLLHIESSLDRLGLLSPTHDQRSQQQMTNTFQPVLVNNSKFLEATHRTKIRKIEIPRSMVVEALSC